MKQILPFILLFSTTFLQAQHILTINIDGIKNNKGQAIVSLLDSEGKMITYKKEKIVDGKSTLIFENLKPGIYGFKYCHDENNDGNINYNFIGIPKEGFGFSNNAKVKMKEPPFSETTFEINGDVTQNCIAIYM